jgi:quercetin dioxygenase-like cupin family protein
MNIKSLHSQNKEVSAQSLFKGELGSATAIQLQKNGILKEHLSKTAAIILCINGKTVFEDEKGKKISIESGDYVHIAPNLKHWLKGIEDSNLVLLK